VSKALADLGKRKVFYFQNFYGVQRFGLPGQPKVTHRIGMRLLGSDYPAAFELLVKSGAREAQAAGLGDSPEEFFARLDLRTRAFYQNAYASFEWNQQLSAVAEATGDFVRRVSAEQIEYAFLRDEQTLIELLRAVPRIRCRSFRAVGTTICESATWRPSVIQTQIRNGAIENDEFHPGQFACKLAFFLPAGCYATIVIEQMLCLCSRLGVEVTLG
jgi:tRNA pseudouridine13 synthase